MFLPRLEYLRRAAEDRRLAIVIAGREAERRFRLATARAVAPFAGAVAVAVVGVAFTV